MTTHSNPAIPRLRHIAKTYEPHMVFLVGHAWLEAVGADELRADMDGQVLDDGRDPLELIKAYIEDGDAPKTSRFDRYLPWAAREINRAWKPVVRGFALGGPTPLASTTEHAFQMKRKGEPLGELGPAIFLADVSTQDILVGLRAIVDWAEANQIDINRYSLGDALAASKTWAADRPAEAIAQGDVVYTFDDGWTVQDLTTEEQIKDEGDVMQHCVAMYGDYITSGRVSIYSLRDPAGRPHATMEVMWSRDGTWTRVAQLRGKQNAMPLRPYLERMIEFRRGYVDQMNVNQDPSWLDWRRTGAPMADKHDHVDNDEMVFFISQYGARELWDDIRAREGTADLFRVPRSSDGRADLKRRLMR